MNKKSQAALEFQATYLWAFIIIVIIIAAFVYFGVLNPVAIIPDRCNFGSEIECQDAVIGVKSDGRGVLRLRLKNNLHEPIVVNSWNTLSDAAVPFSCNIKPETGIWLSHEVMNFEFSDCNNDASGVILGERRKIEVQVNYHHASSSINFAKDVDGEVVGTVVGIDILAQAQCSDGFDNDGNGCIDFAGGDTGCSNSLDETEAGGTCQGQGQDLSLQCYVSDICNDTPVFGLSALSDAHAETPDSSNFAYRACCKSATDTLSNSCASPDAVPLHLSSSTDAHAEKNTQSNYNINACLSANTGAISCSYATASCAVDETCLATISANTDAHVGDCVTQPFADKICCKIT